jgi:hypothetical protein
MPKTEHISYRRTHAIHHAQKFAEFIGLPLNTTISINLSTIDVAEPQASQKFANLVRLRFNPWFRRANSNLNNIPPTYYWVRENEGGVGVHWLLHLPKAMRRFFIQKLHIWIDEIATSPVQPNTIDIQATSNSHGFRLYALKGASPHVARMFGVNHVAQGIVTGARTGVSRNLQRASRQRAGYSPRRMWQGFTSNAP